MWNYNNDLNNWFKIEDKLELSDFDLFKQELSSYQLYSKCLSGASFIPIRGTNDIYDILSNDLDKTYYISITGSQYSNTLLPSNNPEAINLDSSYDYYERNNKEYSLTLKNLFTPNRLIKDSLKNYIEVDVATTEEILDLFQNLPNRIIDGVKLVEGHRVLVKDQKTRVILPNNIDPDTFFLGKYEVIEQIGLNTEYSFYNEQNGIYTYDGNNLIKSEELDLYENCIRYSVIPKLGILNKEKQFHLDRLRTGFFPTTLLNEPIYFKEAKNWILKHQVDYNNLFEINYYDVIKHGTQSYSISGITYSIPERIISIGEFGVIINNQYGISNIINNKYKVNLRSIDQTTINYWICGDSGTLLKVRKHDFNIDKIEIDVNTNLKSISFYDDLNGVIVGDFNVILITKNGGISWEKINIEKFDGLNYNKVLFKKINKFYIAGNSGTFIEFEKNFDNWIANKRRINKFIDEDDDYILVDNINDMLFINIDWNINFIFSTQSIPINKEILILVTDDSKFITHDINHVIPDLNQNSNNPDFIYLDFPENYGDIINIERMGTSSTFYFTGNDGLYSFDINDFQNIGVNNSFSNTIQSTQSAILESNLYSNQIFDYNSQDLILAGNNSLLVSSTYSTIFNFNSLDPNFKSRLKSKLLFLDYDIASKLNWFQDDGEYRLPNDISFTYSNVYLNDYIKFEPITYVATPPSFMTQSETNWIEYWKDRKMTFEYYSNNPMDGSILISSTFSYSSISTSETISNISRTASNIINLAPTILDPEHSRYNGFGLTQITAPYVIFNLYLYDYLGIYRVNSNYPVNLGDLIRIESQVVNGNFIVNKITTISGFKYIYFFTEFNDNIIRELSETTVTITNLNKYTNQEELSNRFNLHDFSNGYDMIYSTQSNILEIKPKFNNLTSYYNLATALEVEINNIQDSYTSEYPAGFLKFGYKPTYNLLDYLESINDVNDPNPVFLSTKTYYAMPDYRGIPISNLTSNNIFVELPNPSYNNIFNEFDIRLNFGEDLKLEWESIFINTFVDININSGIINDLNNTVNNYIVDDYVENYFENDTFSDSTKRLLVYKKYEKTENGQKIYVIEFVKKFDFSGLGAPVSQNLANLQQSGLGTIDIISRRELWQISDDLQYLNNISRPKNRIQYQSGTTQSGQQWITDYDRYERDINFKINTDSYAKILLSDADTKKSITGIIYTDFKNELSFNVVNLEEEYEIPILNTSNFGSNLFISCSKKHGLKTSEGVILEFNGGTGSSQDLNQQYFGYHPVTVVNEFQFYIDGLAFGNTIFVGNDTGVVKYTRRDPFFNYSPVDLIEVGSDLKNKISIELDIKNIELANNKFNLINIDFNKYRFRLVDGLNIETLAINYSWIYEAEISNAVIGESNGELVWYSGIWRCGRWFGGIWQSGDWLSGDWYKGIWNSKLIKDNWISVEVDDKSSVMSQSSWFGGRWYDGTWNNGTWNNGRWYGGTWNNGKWFKGIWNDGIWNNGTWSGGIWVLGTWNNGFFNTNSEPSYWLDGKWNGGDFENGIWYNGFFDEKQGIESRFGVRSFNSRTSTWHSGKFVKGSFHSRLNLDNKGEYDVSEIHKFSIWRTGQWLSGDYYGGVAYNIDFKSGTWHGGVLEDIQVVGIDQDSITNLVILRLNGIFKFNIGDEIVVIDNGTNSQFNSLGSNFNPIRYKVLNYIEMGEFTDVYINSNINITLFNPSPPFNTPINTGLRVVSLFRNCNWKSGIWTNGIYESGNWEGGIWYNGIFENNANFL
jgi:hypothetical protein